MVYCGQLHPSFNDETPEEDDLDTPSNSHSGQPIRYGPVSATPNLGISAPTLMEWVNKRWVKTLARKCTVPDVTVRRSTRARIAQATPPSLWSNSPLDVKSLYAVFDNMADDVVEASPVAAAGGVVAGVV
ncbi:hypothetical protein GUJ93_ZPchr0001g32554 [Zizania palustris]|uniref:Uncharacterized protein n=1 Tax=Zizania palustris TaxID=103762 RepID=A0A8J5VAH1_ZIZPA|nr:hypothetical protein GUJ93_ZPchr0001g32554 [Zizania palustris]